jgi:hypothetical protein
MNMVQDKLKWLVYFCGTQALVITPPVHDTKWLLQYFRGYTYRGFWHVRLSCYMHLR